MLTRRDQLKLKEEKKNKKKEEAEQKKLQKQEEAEKKKIEKAEKKTSAKAKAGAKAKAKAKSQPEEETEKPEPEKTKRKREVKRRRKKMRKKLLNQRPRPRGQRNRPIQRQKNPSQRKQHLRPRQRVHPRERPKPRVHRRVQRPSLLKKRKVKIPPPHQGGNFFSRTMKVMTELRLNQSESIRRLASHSRRLWKSSCRSFGTSHGPGPRRRRPTLRMVMKVRCRKGGDVRRRLRRRSRLGRMGRSLLCHLLRRRRSETQEEGRGSSHEIGAWGGWDHAGHLHSAL